MRTLLTVFLLLCFNWGVKAQQQPFKVKYKTVTKDTIHIRGIVYDTFDNVVPRFHIYSANKESETQGYMQGTITDTSGRFYLKGALFHDTLTTAGVLRDDIKVIINGSRYVEIHLPASYNPPVKVPALTISAKRTGPKRKPASFKIETNTNPLDYYGIRGYDLPEYPYGSKEKYYAFIYQNLIYPEKAVANNIEGEVEIGFTIERTGAISKLKVVRGLGYGCDEAVMYALLKCPKWRSAQSVDGRRTYPASVTINFKLTDK